MWRPNILVHILGFKRNMLSVVLDPDLPHTSFVLSMIYGPSRFSHKHQFWDNMEDLAASISEPWVLVGDFNAVSSQQEKQGGKPFDCSSRYGLTAFVTDIGFIDLGFNGNPFTWNNDRQGCANIKERPGRGLVNSSWRILFSQCLRPPCSSSGFRSSLPDP